MAVYLDNAATSFPKPDTVHDAVDRYARSIGAPAGRGGYAEAREVQATISRCRKMVSDLFDLGSPDHVVMTSNCTESLNIVLHGLLGPGDHVVTTLLEHNSIRRPLAHLQRAGVETSIVDVGSDHLIDPDRVREALRPNTRLVAVLHASNVSGVIQPVAEIAQAARDAGALVLLDAAQTAGQRPVSFSELPIDFLAAAGHKSLLGPLGTGVLCIRPGAERELDSLKQGGTGSASESEEQPGELPDRLESGNLNVPGIYGLVAGLEDIRSRGVAEVMAHEAALMSQLVSGLTGLDGVHVYAATAAERAGVLSFNVAGYDPQDVAAILDESFGVRCRAGLHCAPGAHEALGTLKSGGTVRVSPGVFSTPDDIQTLIDGVTEIAGAV